MKFQTAINVILTVAPMKGYPTTESAIKRYSYDATLHRRQSPDARHTGDRAHVLDLPAEFKQELESCIREKENLKIAYDGEKAAREFAEQQLRQSSRRQDEAHRQIDRLQTELLAVKDKYRRLKHRRNRQEPQAGHNEDARQARQQFDEEREVFLKQQQLLKEQIARLEHEAENAGTVREQELRTWQREREIEMRRLRAGEEKALSDLRALTAVRQALEKELELACLRAEEKGREALLLETKLEEFQLANMRTHQDIATIEQEVERVRAENHRLKATLRKNEEAFQASLDREAQEARRRYSELYEEVQELRAVNRLRQNEYRRVRYGHDIGEPAQPGHRLTEVAEGRRAADRQ